MASIMTAEAGNREGGVEVWWGGGGGFKVGIGFFWRG